jgi:amino-acid N-acetyltransferase
VGRAVVERLEKLALSRGIESVFALTLTPPFFESLGYAVVDRSLYPEKIRRDCVGCPRRFGCGEVTVGRTLRPAVLEVAA